MNAAGTTRHWHQRAGSERSSILPLREPEPLFLTAINIDSGLARLRLPPDLT